MHSLRRRLANSSRDPESKLWGDVDPQRLEAAATFFFDTKQIPEKVNLKKILDTSLLRQANDFDEAAVVQHAKNFRRP